MIAAKVKPPSRENTESVDDYLKAIYALGGDGQRRVGGSELAAWLGISPASVTNMLQRLAADPDSPVDYALGGGVRLSGSGRRRALEIVRHHRLLESFLFRVLGYPLDELHAEAERLEHFISETLEERIAIKLGHPPLDPHGRCIPAKDGTLPAVHGAGCRCTSPLEPSRPPHRSSPKEL